MISANHMNVIEDCIIINLDSPCFLGVFFNSLSGNPTKWSNTLKHFVGYCRRIVLSVFDHFVRLALKGLTNNIGSHPIDLLKMPHLRPSLFEVSKETSLSKNKKK